MRGLDGSGDGQPRHMFQFLGLCSLSVPCLSPALIRNLRRSDETPLQGRGDCRHSCRFVRFVGPNLHPPTIQWRARPLEFRLRQPNRYAYELKNLHARHAHLECFGGLHPGRGLPTGDLLPSLPRRTLRIASDGSHHLGRSSFRWQTRRSLARCPG